MKNLIKLLIIGVLLNAVPFLLFSQYDLSKLQKKLSA